MFLRLLPCLWIAGGCSTPTTSTTTTALSTSGGTSIGLTRSANAKDKGGAQTLDGPTQALFDGKDIPHIWTGKLSIETKWTAP